MAVKKTENTENEMIDEHDPDEDHAYSKDSIYKDIVHSPMSILIKFNINHEAHEAHEEHEEIF